MIRQQISSLTTLILLTTLLFWIPATVTAGNAPISIEADNMSSKEKNNSVLFKGNVDAKQGDVQIRSDEMTVYYSMKKNGQDKKGSNKKQANATQQVEKLICIGNVEITRAEWLGTSDKMDYLAQERQVILKGNAKAYQGQNMVSGDKIVYYIDEGRSEVIGDGNRTQTTMGGKKKKSRVNMTIMQN
jgi:lipopolysaccharide export system protein LptA